jgi:hypothetical protein
MKRRLLSFSILAVLGHLTTVLSFTDAPGNMNSMFAAIFRNLDYQAHIEPYLFGYLPEVSGHSNSDQRKASNNKYSQHLLLLKTGELFRRLLFRMLMLIVFGLMRKFAQFRAVIFQQYVLICPWPQITNWMLGYSVTFSLVRTRIGMTTMFGRHWQILHNSTWALFVHIWSAQGVKVLSASVAWKKVNIGGWYFLMSRSDINCIMFSDLHLINTQTRLLLEYFHCKRNTAAMS